jgi:hypothetical protein
VSRCFLRRVGEATRALTPVFNGLWRAHRQPIRVVTALRAFAHPTIVALAVFLTGAASGQQQPRLSIWDVQLGTSVRELPDEEFVDPACGTNGGPPGLRLEGFEAFARCRPEASGLREIWFRYDDELEYIARAARDPDAVEHNNAMLMLGQPVILSLLVDPAGLVQGFRIFTDPHAEEDVRASAYTLAAAFKARFGAEGWDCKDLPPAAGETPVAGTFAKQLCRKIADGQQIAVESRHYYKSGQALLDPNSGLATVNQFESAARIEIVQMEAVRR